MGSWRRWRQAGIITQAQLRPGTPYRQEYKAGEAEDMAQVLSLRESVTTPAEPIRTV